MLEDPPAKQVKSIQTAFELLNRIQALGGATSAQLTENVDLSKSSVHNYLSTLEMDGYVVNDDGVYRLGLRFLTHGAAARNMAGLAQPIAETLQTSAEEISQPTWHVTEESGRGYFIQNAVPDGATTLYGTVGKRSYLHTHALGKAILALASDDYVTQIIEYHGLPAQTRQTVTDLDTLRDEIDAIRNREYAIAEGEAVLGILSVGVGFRDASDRLHAIGTFGHSRDFAGNRAENIATQLVQTVGDLEERLQTGGS